MTEIYFIRHSMFDRRKTKCENKKIPLTKKGLEYAKKVLNISELKNIDALYASEYLRAQQTAKFVSLYNDNMKINITGLINERVIGSNIKTDPNFWDKQFEDENLKSPDGDSRKEVSDRMLKFIDETLEKHKGEKVVAVCHAIAITFMLLNYCELIDHNYLKKFRYIKYNGKELVKGQIEFCDIYKLSFDDNKKLINIERIRY